MPECDKLATCNFFKTYENEKELETSLRGFAHMYCNGDKQDDCIRKKISQILGGSDKVPPNMMPNGFPLPNTDKSSWSEEVSQALKQI